MCQALIVLCLCRTVLHLSHLSPSLTISFAAFALSPSVTLLLLFSFSFPSLLLVRLCSVEAETCRSAELLKPHHHVLVYMQQPHDIR